MVLLKTRSPGASAVVLERFVRKTCGAVKLAGAVNVLITKNSEMRSLNRRFRGKDAATDVLSFPVAEGSTGNLLPGKLAGDLAISAEIAAGNAQQLGHAVVDEIKVLILHGVLHLAGYDHETDTGTMARKEARLRRELNLPVALIARSKIARTVGRKALPARKRKP
jgi:probable rRNA maturation factor